MCAAIAFDSVQAWIVIVGGVVKRRHRNVGTIVNSELKSFSNSATRLSILLVTTTRPSLPWCVRPAQRQSRRSTGLGLPR